AVHLLLAPFKNTEAVLKWLVDASSDFSHLEADELLIKHTPIDAVPLFQMFARLVHIVTESNV
ncbi:hypothetical protein NL529_27250, partial [Klebsiella pneumoniae]|nr:hypothetical protein [Klebsiella pneumoniae]